MRGWLCPRRSTRVLLQGIHEFIHFLVCFSLIEWFIFLLFIGSWAGRGNGRGIFEEQRSSSVSHATSDAFVGVVLLPLRHLGGRLSNKFLRKPVVLPGSSDNRAVRLRWRWRPRGCPQARCCLDGSPS